MYAHSVCKFDYIHRSPMGNGSQQYDCPAIMLRLQKNIRLNIELQSFCGYMYYNIPPANTKRHGNRIQKKIYSGELVFVLMYLKKNSSLLIVYH
jgi:hypothetical protein